MYLAPHIAAGGLITHAACHIAQGQCYSDCLVDAVASDPDKVEEKEQAVAQKLQAKLDEPVRPSVSVL